jgi:hypothetical protein
MVPIGNLIRRLLCYHTYKQLKWHGLPGEPDLMRCTKCGRITRFKDYLLDWRDHGAQGD